MEQEELTKEERRQMKLERLKIYFGLLNTAVWERYKLLPQISALMATLLVIATFNENVLPLTSCVRFLIIIFLILIPISIIGYLITLYRGEEIAKKNITRIAKDEPVDENNDDSFLAYLPWIIVGIFTMLIVQIIFLIYGEN